MKKMIFILAMLYAATESSAQSVGIGTTTPNSKAALEINSTTKGLLIPSMTSTQRAFISSPPDGLMVYDTDQHQFYQYDGTTWRKLLNSTYWNNSSTHSWVYNSSDSVGIGTSTPTNRLDVNGNVRTRADILADDDVTAGGTVQGATLVATGNLVTGGAATVVGDLSTSSDLIINNATATLQLKTAGENKGYFQLSGDNVRMGTNSGNSTGSLIIRMNGTDRMVVETGGNVGIANTNPAQRLDVGGNINLSGKVMRSTSTGSSNMIATAYGTITSSGTLYTGTSNFTITKQGTGIYTLASSDFTPSTVIVATTPAVNLSIGAGHGANDNELQIYIRLLDTGEFVNAYFNFIAITP